MSAEGVRTVRAHAVFIGQVQGVCFRAYTQERAVRAQLTGWVRNRRDGSVEAVFEGTRDSITEVIDWLRTRHPYAEVTTIELEWSASDGSFTTFTVKPTA